MTREERQQRVAYCRAQGCNCCQSVLLACADLTGLDGETAVSLGYGFAGGMHCGSVCGAVTGGLMALGAACLPGDAPRETRPQAAALSRELQARFQARFGSLLCRELIGPEADRSGCGDCICFAAETVAEFAAQQRQTVDAGTPDGDFSVDNSR